jgi:hypothetical protein
MYLAAISDQKQKLQPPKTHKANTKRVADRYDDALKVALPILSSSSKDKLHFIYN